MTRLALAALLVGVALAAAVTAVAPSLIPPIEAPAYLGPTGDPGALGCHQSGDDAMTVSAGLDRRVQAAGSGAERFLVVTLDATARGRPGAADSARAASDVQVELEVAEGVELLEVFDFRGEMTPWGFRARIDAVWDGERRDVVARLRVPDDAPGDAPVGRLHVRWRGATSGQVGDAVAAVGLRISADDSGEATAEPALVRAAALTLAERALDEARRRRAIGDIEGASAALEAARAGVSALEGVGDDDVTRALWAIEAALRGALGAL